MKAIQMQHYGDPDVLVYTSLPEPEPGPGQILIKVESAAVNYSDIKRRSNTPYPFPTPLPFIPGGEVAGTVEQLGEGVTQPPVGTAVFALAGQGGSTGYAQYAVADATLVIPIPPTLSKDEAASLIVAGATAMLIVREGAKLQPHESILIPGAGGGVGSYAIQLAKLFGAETVIGAVSSANKREAALAAGADSVVDYTQPNWPSAVRELTRGRGVDVALEMSGGLIFAQTLDCLAPFGRVIVYGMASLQPLQLDQETILKFFYNPAYNQSLQVFNLGLWFGLRPEAAGKALQDLIGYAASGKIKVLVSQTLPLSRAAEAHRMIEERRTTGKVILKPWENA
jgi:NADPH:quinone reductase-like Zn-dependent oxidoreductase